MCGEHVCQHVSVVGHVSEATKEDKVYHVGLQPGDSHRSAFFRSLKKLSVKQSFKSFVSQ